MRKRLQLLLLAIMFCFSSCASLNSHLFYDTVSFKEAQEIVNTSHKEAVISTEPLRDIEYIIPNSDKLKNILSPEEIKLLNNKRDVVSSISKEEALEDIDLLFRSFAYAYAPYFYFGEDAFQQAQSELIEAISQKKFITTSEFKELLLDKLAFVKDGHASIGGVSLQKERYSSYLCDVFFSKDESGNYYYYDGEEIYYLTEISNSSVKIRLRLLKDGSIAYSPIQWCLPSVHHEYDTMVLHSSTGETVQRKIRWYHSTSQSLSNPSIFSKTMDSDILVYSIRSFSNNYKSELIQFASDGISAKRAKVIIFDLRGNLGGSDGYSGKWFNGFTGTNYSIPRIWIDRYSSLGPNYCVCNVGNEKFNTNRTYGKFVENDVPILVLVDEHVASAAEGTLDILKTMNNVMVIGSNTGGYLLSGNGNVNYLPNSGLSFCLGSDVVFTYNTEEKDGKGYEPDIWSDPVDCLSASLAMIAKSGCVNQDSVLAIEKELEIVNRTVRLQIDNDGMIIDTNRGFGRGDNPYSATVLVNEKPYYGKYSIEVINSNGIFSRREDGHLSLKTNSKGPATINIIIDNQKYPFIVYGAH